MDRRIILAMNLLRPSTSASVLVVVDLQPKFLAAIPDAQRLLIKARFLLQVASLLDVPALATEQVPEKMGPTASELASLLTAPPVSKRTFGCCEEPAFRSALSSIERRQVVLIGVETHICISQTALGLTSLGYEVAVCPDAVGARSQERHKLGMERIRDAGVAPIHTEGVVYEWLQQADHPRFREALEFVKQSSAELGE